MTTIAHRAHPLGFKEQIIPLWDLECLVDDAATFYTDCGSDRPCARTRSAHVPAKPSGPVRPLSKWAGDWEPGQTQLLRARHRRASGLAAVDARTVRGHPTGEMRCMEVRLVGPPGLAPFLVVLGGDVREKRGVDRRFHGAAAVRRARQPRSRPEWAKLTRAAVPRQVDLPQHEGGPHPAPARTPAPSW